MLRKTRLTLAMVFFMAITALFLDFTGTIHAWLGWMAKIQFLPALLAMNVGVVVFLILLTMMVGRVYCSVICPLGVMQDIVSWFSGRRKAKRLRFAYSPEKRWLRLGVLGLFVIAMIAGFSSLAALKPASQAVTAGESACETQRLISVASAGFSDVTDVTGVSDVTGLSDVTDVTEEV